MVALSCNNMSISPVYVPSAENKADTLSHSCLGPAASHLQNTVPVPPCLMPLLCCTYLSICNTLNRSLLPLQLPLICPVPLKHAHHHAKPKDSINPSPLHPLVPAADRFIHWLTPFRLNHMNCLSKPSHPQLSHVSTSSCVALSPRTH